MKSSGGFEVHGSWFIVERFARKAEDFTSCAL